MLAGNYTCKPPEKLPLSNWPWDAAESSRRVVQQLCCVLGSSHPVTQLVHRGQGFVAGSERAFACCTPFCSQEEQGGMARYPNVSNSQPRSPPQQRSIFPVCTRGAEQSARGCAGDDRLCTDVHYMIIIIILPRIRDERDDYDGYKEALVSWGF